MIVLAICNVALIATVWALVYALEDSHAKH